MKILFTGGESGGHFYPIISVVQAIRDLEEAEHLIGIDLYYVGDAPFDKDALELHRVSFKKIRTGKRRLYFSIKNFFDLFKTFFAFLGTLGYMYKVFPDVVFSKGGAVSFPVLLSARILGIPVMIHESDSYPGRTNMWAGKFAKSIAISYPEAAEHFPKEKTVLTGQPIRKELISPVREGAREYLKLNDNVPIILILGGSQGSQKINDTVLGILPELLENYQIIHQVGEHNMEFISGIIDGVLINSKHKDRYRFFGHFEDFALKMSAGAADLVITRAGSTLFEIATWKKPSVIVPITHSNGNHQMKNAYHFVRAGASIVIEEENLTPHILKSEIDRLFADPELMKKMSEGAASLAVMDAARKIAHQLIRLGMHEETNPKKK